MKGPRREDRTENRTTDSPEEEPLRSVIREYVSLRNRNIFFLMVLSVIPAAICQAFYMKLGVLDIKGIIYTPFFRVDYTQYIPIEYDFIIQPLVVLTMLNVGLIGIKLIGWGIADEKKETLVSDFEKYLFPGIIALYFIFLIFSDIPSLMWAFLLVIILLYLLTKTSSKIVIFFTLLLFNMIMISIYYKYFQFEVLIGGNADDILTFMAKIGFSWLYILPYNFFIFFPLVISIHFWDFRHPEKYISSFFDVVFHENMVAVFVGLLLNAMLSVIPLIIVIAQPEIILTVPEKPVEGVLEVLHRITEGIINTFHEVFAQEEPRGLRTFETIALFHFWIGSFTLWFTPFFVSFAQLETKFEANFDRNLRDIIQKMKDHIVVIGFGNLGKKVCTDLIERDVVSREDDTIEIFTPDLEVQKICKSLLVVDVNDHLFDRVHTDPVLQNVGVARRKTIVGGKKEDILIPAIIGDINSETTRDSSRLKDTKLFISAPSDYRATFTLSKFANSNDLDSIISVEDSAQKDYFSPKITAHDTFLIYPAFQEGIALGRITSLCYLRLEEEGEKSKNPEIVIAGEGKQIHYLMETFWMEMERVGIAPSYMDQKKETDSSSNRETIRLPISILTDNKELKKRSKPKEGEKDERKREYEEIIKRSANISQKDSYLLVDVTLDTPDRLKTIEEIIRDKEPQIIVVTSNTIQKVTKIFHEWVVGVERHISVKNKDYKPVIIVGVRGDEYEEIKDILLYYTKMEHNSGVKFPIQYIDAVVRAYDDSQEQIGGLAQSFVRKDSQSYRDRKIREIEDPFALYCCMEDVPGILGNLLGKLAGIRFTYVNPLDTENLVSLHFCRFQRCSGVENYSFLANAEIYRGCDIKIDKNLFSCLFQSESGDPEKTQESIKRLLNIESVREVLGENPDPSQLQDICSSCCRRITCSIASYLRKVENLIKNRRYYEHLEELGKFKRKKRDKKEGKDKKSIVDRELERFFINPNFHISSMVREQEIQNLPKASILVCCRHSKITGSLSAIVNNLLSKRIDKIYEEDVVDTTYLRSYECYNPALTNIEFYGNLVKIHKDKREFLKKKGSIDSVFIDVVTKKDAWLDYAKKLCRTLNDIYEDTYEIWADDCKSPYNIAVIRKEFIGGEGSEKYLTCKKKGCIIHDKVRLLKEKININE